MQRLLLYNTYIVIYAYCGEKVFLHFRYHLNARRAYLGAWTSGQKVSFHRTSITEDDAKLTNGNTEYSLHTQTEIHQDVINNNT